MRSLIALLALATSSTVTIASENREVETSVKNTVQIRTVDLKGKPPYKREVEELEVVDAASMTHEEEVSRKKFKPVGRPPYKRYPQ